MRRLLPSAALAVLAVIVACDESPSPRPVTCGPEEILVDGACVVPGATCTPDAPSSIEAACAARNRACFEDSLGALCGVCLSGFVADGDACRPRRTCDDLGCEDRGRTCFANGDADASCGACVAGHVEKGGECVAVSCDPSDSAGPAASCIARKRACVESEEGPACGECWYGHAEEAGSCRPVRTCGDASCRVASRLCTPAGPHSDAVCGDCRAGFDDDAGLCVRRTGTTCDAGGPESILAGCQTEHRGCAIAPDGSAECTACLAGFAEDPDSGLCVENLPCSELGCDAQHRGCEQVPFGRCTGCTAGFAEDPATGSCRPAVTCAMLTCADGSTCEEGGPGRDAACVPSCGPGTVRTGDICARCPPCDGAGEDGAWPELTRTGYCICRTQPGYFYSVSGDVGTFLCDADGDGWLRESARIALGSQDPVISSNARCSVRQIDAFVLVSEGGASKRFPLQVPLAMFETDRNDDEQLLAAIFEATGIPPHGRAIHAAELNRLTKLCHTRRADYNDNGMPDVEEWGGADLAPTMRPEQRPFNAYSYFSELATGRFDPSIQDPSRGDYVVAERSRDPAGADALAIGYARTDGGYWRGCTVRRDAEFETQSPPIGMDFADRQQPGDGWPGMNHHSQFKCVVMDDQPRPQVPTEMKPAQALDYLERGEPLRLNRCEASGEPAPQERNAAIPAFACSIVPSFDVQAGSVFWAAVPYLDYDPFRKTPGVDETEYLRGCVNECADQLTSCPGYELNPRAVSCDYDAADFGRFLACEASELCDGFDNDGNGAADDGNPGGGIACANDGSQLAPDLAAAGHVVAAATPCSTSADCSGGFICGAGGVCVAAGVCEPGHTTCQAGRIVCTPDVAPGSRIEACNVDHAGAGVDDDCDGETNESDERDGNVCDTTLKGACRLGVLACDAASGEEICVQTVFPSTEVCTVAGDAVDEDCDGDADDLDVDSRPMPSLDPNTSVYSCANDYHPYFKDQDRDTYGERGGSPLCLCKPGAVQHYVATRGNDCCDTDGNAFPGQGAWFRGPSAPPWTGPSACGSWDYNCNGNVEKEVTSISPSGCKSGQCADSGNAGWYDTQVVPECGEQTTYTDGTCDPCTTRKFLRYQGCH